MSSDKELSPSNSSGDMAVVGEGTPNQTPISFQVLQSIYHELTGKSEELSQFYDEPYIFTHNDFEQLNHRINQTCEQYNIRANNTNIKVYYTNDTNETFSSFDRFKIFNSGCTNAVESVLITYNFLVILPKTNLAQSYTISIRAASRISIEKKMRSDVPFNIPKILRIMGGRTGVVNIKYIDYAVARNLRSVVDDWFKTLHKSKTSSVFNFIRNKSNYFPLILRYSVGLFAAYSIFVAIPSFIPPTANLQDYAKFSLVALVSIFASYRIAHHLGNSVETSLDRWSELSFIDLTGADKKEIILAEKLNKRSLISAGLKLVASAVFSLAIKAIVVFLAK